VEHFVIRPGEPRDLESLSPMLHALWGDTTAQEHGRELAPLLAGHAPGTLPAVVFVAEAGNCLIGFVMAGLRSHADGCDPARPVGFLEGWYVDPAYRRRRAGAELVAAAEEWARTHGCVEMASDTWISNLDSQKAHEGLGFEVVDRCVNYRKRL
jgi:aminoglycoside 6'-N-acetyltransferase I